MAHALSPPHYRSASARLHSLQWESSPSNQVLWGPMGANEPQNQAQGTTRKLSQAPVATVVNTGLQHPSYSALLIIWRCTWILLGMDWEVRQSTTFSLGNTKSEICWLKTSKWNIFLSEGIHLYVSWTSTFMKDSLHEWKMQFSAPVPRPYLGWYLQD